MLGAEPMRQTDPVVLRAGGKGFECAGSTATVYCELGKQKVFKGPKSSTPSHCQSGSPRKAAISGCMPYRSGGVASSAHVARYGHSRQPECDSG